MRNKMLTGFVVLFAVVLGLIMFASERSISHFMEACGDLIARVIGF